MTPLEAAAQCIDRGLLPIPIPFREKAPKIRDWPSLRLTKADLEKHFNGVPSNLGVILGDDYGTADVDLDCSEAIAAARELLPETGLIFGRQSKPASHYFYRSDPPIRSKRFLDPIEKVCLVELRCRKSDGTVGLQTVVPPSVHPEGEQIRFERGFDKYPANVDASTLQAAVSKIAAVAVLAKQWPGEKAGRNQAFIALAGALARGDWSIEEATALARALYRVLWGAGADLSAADAEVRSTYEKHRGGFQTTGKRSLTDLIDRRAVDCAFSCLGISQPSPPHKAPSPKASPVVAHSKSMEDLIADDSIGIPELIIEGLLPKCGLVLLGGRPKDGKSWFACQLALSVATGQALGRYLKVREPGRVQLWALEDQYGLTKDKVKKLLQGTRPDGVGDIRIFAELAEPILRGGDEIIKGALQQHPSELIILDSLFKLTGATQAQCDISQRDYDVIDRVRKIAIEHNCLAAIVMHTKKGARGGNPVENIIGTSGTSAAADAVIELKRTSAREGKLTVVGRLVPQEDYELAWHGGPDEWGWTIESTGDDASIGETSQEVLGYLEAQGATKPATIAAALRKSFGSVWMSLQRLQARGKVIRGRDKKWELFK
jgi:hypothetical protein